ncbi:MAG: penicillin-binding transpeptidase domain-containing protein, partial [Clostridia bacterium]|nr:penicillin-binding transpeptidase domain-containing protein [Clostridia bacterium]
MKLAKSEKKGRFITLIVIFIGVFLLFVGTLVKIQLISSDDVQKESLISSVSSTVKATRGQILDRNGKALVGNRQGSNIVFRYSQFPKEQSERNKIIIKLIELFESNGLEWNDDMPIVLDANGNYQFEEDRETDIKTMKSADMLHLNKYATADDCMQELCDRYELSGYSKSDARKIASVCYEMRANVFNSANPYTFAEDVSSEIVAVIKENSAIYTGVDVEIVSYREYTDGSIAPHILGITGVINAEEYDELKSKGYSMDDVVGKSGIESTFEENLKGTNGVRTVSTATDGTQTTTVEGLKNGDNIMLTIDADLQKIAQDSLAAKCKEISTANAGGGSVVVMNCKTGEVLAMASYPTYNLETYYDDYESLAKNTNSPLYNRALLSTYAPGSTA